jgi:hypothetical protein
MRPDVALREDPLRGRLADRRHDLAGGRLLAHVLEGPRDRDVLALPAAVLPGGLPTDRLTGQRDDLAAGHRAEFQCMAPAREILKALEVLTQEPPAPALDAPNGDSQAIRDLTRAAAFGARQDDPPRAASRCVLVGARTREDSAVASSGVSSNASGGRPPRAEEPTSANYRTGVSAKCTALFPSS